MIQQADLADDHNLAATKSAIFDMDTDEGQRFNNYIETVTHWISTSFSKKNPGSIEDYLQLFPYLALIWNKNNTQLQQATTKLVLLFPMLSFTPQMTDTFIGQLETISKNWNWHTRARAATSIQSFIPSNIYNLNNQPGKSGLKKLLAIVLSLLEDEMPEVRTEARNVYSALITWHFYDRAQHLATIEELKAKCADPNLPVAVRHGAILGISAHVYAYPKKFPKYIPDILLFLCQYLHEPQPIQNSVNETLKSFMKTHQDNWIEHKNKFTEQQLETLSDCSSFSSYIS